MKIERKNSKKLGGAYFLSIASGNYAYEETNEALDRAKFSLFGYTIGLAVTACEKHREPGQARKGAAESATFCDALPAAFFLNAMSYLVLARKYRPRSFDEVSGQEHVTRTLSNAIERDKVAHAFLFSGPRGVGKTSIARILAKALNATGGPATKIPADCPISKEVDSGASIGVREIDGASHNSVDNVRDLIESFRSLPPPGYRYKVYIIDEVHMLSTAAFNALLKSIEEPPPHTIFILATTELHKIPETVISRCQHYEFRSLSVSNIESRLLEICDREQIKYERGAIRLISSMADGSMRDAQSLLDRVQLFCDGEITVADTSSLLGAVERPLLHSLIEAIISRDSNRALSTSGNCFSTGTDISRLLSDFVEIWRDLLLATFSGRKALENAGFGEDEQTDLLRLAESLSSRDLVELVQIARAGCDSALKSAFPKHAFEALIVRMSLREPVEDLAKLLQGLGSKRDITTVPEARSKTLPKKPDNAYRVEAALSFDTFVRFVLDSGFKMLGEHLRRVSALTFDKGLLALQGVPFSIDYLKRNKDNLAEILSKYSDVKAPWELRFEGVNATNENDSLHARELSKEAIHKASREESIREHPTVQSLTEIFPGSEIEKITIGD